MDYIYLNFYLKKNYRVIGTVRSVSSLNKKNFNYLGVLDKIIIKEIDLLDITNIINLIRDYNPHEIYNLAAQSSVGLSFKSTYRNVYF